MRNVQYQRPSGYSVAASVVLFCCMVNVLAEHQYSVESETIENQDLNGALNKTGEFIGGVYSKICNNQTFIDCGEAALEKVGDFFEGIYQELCGNLTLLDCGYENVVKPYIIPVGIGVSFGTFLVCAGVAGACLAFVSYDIICEIKSARQRNNNDVVPSSSVEIVELISDKNAVLSDISIVIDNISKLGAPLQDNENIFKLSKKLSLLKNEVEREDFSAEKRSNLYSQISRDIVNLQTSIIKDSDLNSQQVLVDSLSQLCSNLPFESELLNATSINMP